jgi:TonB family protein
MRTQILGTLRGTLPVAALCGVLAVAGAQQAPTPPPESPPGERVAADSFHDPRPTNIPRTSFPVEEQQNVQEGWVIVSMMVDPQGKPFEVGVVTSTGNKTFEHLAVKAMEKATFIPGALDNKPIESVYEIKYTFQIEDLGPGAREEFVHTYSAFQRALNAHDQAAAQAALQKLKITTLYEDAFYGLAAYRYAEQWGDERQQAARP